MQHVYLVFCAFPVWVDEGRVPWYNSQFLCHLWREKGNKEPGSEVVADSFYCTLKT